MINNIFLGFFLFIYLFYFIRYHIQQEFNLLSYSMWLCNDYNNRSDNIQWNKSRKKQYQNNNN